MRSLTLGLFAFFGLLFTWSPANAQCPNGRCSPVVQASVSFGTLSADGIVLISGTDGKTYVRGSDGVYRLYVEKYVCKCCGPVCPCLCDSNRGPDCTCYYCTCNRVIIGGKTYKLDKTGTYR